MSHRAILVFCGLILSGVGLSFIPDGVSATIRSVMTDLLKPGQVALRIAIENTRQIIRRQDVAATSEEIDQLFDELEVERERNRALQVRLAEFAEREMMDREISPAMLKSMSSKRLIVPELIEVAVMGDVIADHWRSGKLLDQGAKSGLRENEVVISSNKSHRPLLDVGEDARLSTEDSILLGRCVIGKIENVGRWSSTIQFVTDPRYRGKAQVIRETDSGFIFAAQGILKGVGDSLCKLEGIAAGKSVRVNDSVYTAERDGILPTPLYDGRIVEATLGPDDRDWTIYVKPASIPSHLTTVQVLRTAINPERLAVK